MEKGKPENFARTKYQLQEAGSGMIIVGIVGLMMYLSVSNPFYPLMVCIIGLMTFAVGRMLK